MSHDPVERNAARPRSAAGSVSADGPGTSGNLPATQLGEMEARYRSVFEASSDGLVIHDSEGYIVEINPAYCQMLGYDRDELIGKHVSVLIPPEHYHLIAEGMQSIGAGDIPQAQVVILRKDGTPLQVEGHGAAFLLNGSLHYLGVTRDIPERVKAEENLRKKEAEYRGVFESTSDALIIGDVEGVVVEVNPAACELYGYSHDEFVGLSISALIHPDYLQQGVEQARTIEAGGTVQAQEIALRKDGTSFHAEVRGTRFTYGGQSMRLAIVRDISERIEAEEKLRESEAQYRGVFEATSDGLGIVDLEGKLVEVNPAYCRLVGYSRDELIGMPATSIMHPDQHHLIPEGMQTILDEGGSVHNRAVLVRKDGTLLHVDGSGTAFTYRGKPHVLGVVRDITERVRAEEQLREREAQYRSIFESSADGLGIFDQKGYLVEANPAYCRMLGYSHTELIGLHASATVHPDYHHVIAEGLERANRDVPFRREIALLRKGGASFPAEAGATTFTYRGTPHELVVLRDMSERVEAERQIHEREAEYRGIVEATNDGLMISDLDGYIVEVNPAYCRMFGYTREEVIGLHSAALAAPESRHTIAESVQTLTSDDTYQTLAKALRKDGSTFFAEARATRFMYRGKLHYLSVVQDVTERVLAYELLEERVEQRTRELATLLDISHDVTSTLEVRPLLDLVLEQLKSVAEYHGAGIVQLVGDELQVIGYRGPIPQDIALQTAFPANSLPVWDHLTRGEPVIIHDVRGDDALARAYQLAAGDRLETLYAYVRCFLAVPMTLKGQVIGALTLEHSQPGYYSDRHLSLAMAVAQQAAIAIENARLYEQTVQRTSELSALLDVSRNVASTLELKPLLDLILDGLKTLVDSVACTLMSIEDGQSVALARRGPGDDELIMQYRLRFEDLGPIAEEIGRGRPVIIDDVRGDGFFAQAYRRGMGELIEKLPYLRSWMAVPMLLKKQVAGALIVGHDRPGYFTGQHARLAQAMAQHAALAIENARLYDKAQQVAALEERQRLARELHDSVSQALFGIRLGARTAQALLERDPAQAAESIDYVLSLAQGGMAEMRALIFELRPESLEKEGLVQALTKQADAVRARHEIPVSLAVCEEPAVPLPVKEALYRIAQEALHNTVKHAQPRSVDLSLEQNEGELVLEVRDDGQGFDLGGSFPGHLGLQSMRERAQRVGGTVEIESWIGEGTRVRVCVPMHPSE